MTKDKDKEKLAKETQLAQSLKEEEIRRMMQEARLKAAQTETVEPEEEFAVTPVIADHWQQIIAKYKKRPDAKEIKDGILAFSTMEDAKLFFTEMAANGLEFLATRVDNGQRMDEHFYSCGDNRIYEGSFAEIVEQLQDALKTETSSENQAKITNGIEYIKSFMPKSELNPAAEMRSKLQKVTESDLSTHADKIPNPFK